MKIFAIHKATPCVSAKQRHRGYEYRSRAAEHALCPQAAATGRMGIADTVLLILRKQFAVSAVKAGSEFKIIKFPAKCPIFTTVPNIGQKLLFDITEAAVGNFSADIF